MKLYVWYRGQWKLSSDSANVAGVLRQRQLWQQDGYCTALVREEAKG